MGSNGTQNLAPRHERDYRRRNANVPFTETKIAKKVTKLLYLGHSLAEAMP
jgi:hypothetical protein